MVRARQRGRASARIFARWDLHADVIGQVTDDGLIRVRDGAAVVAELPIALLTDDAPAYEPPARSRPQPPPRRSTWPRWPSRRDLGAALLTLLGSPNLAAAAPHLRPVRPHRAGQHRRRAGRADAAVLRVEGTRQGLALTADCNPRYAALDPRRGAAQAVAEAARNLACCRRRSRSR